MEVSGMLNPISILADSFGDYLAGQYLQYFSYRNPEYATYLGGAARLVLERIGNSDALYHDIEHTIMVTQVGQQIIRGRLLSQALVPEDWLHYTCACIVHDIGFVRGICRGDNAHTVVINEAGETVTPPRGASDAFLAPWHVDRGKIYARDRFGRSPYVDAQRICAAIEMTRFPVPKDEAHAATETEGALVRAADLIGQMADPFYHRKINALYLEFIETGAAEALGYTSAADLVDKYPEFFWSQVQPLIGPALGYLELTTEGKQWIAALNSNVFQVEHSRRFAGPFPGRS
jgi:hypothetical protein